MRAPRVAYFTDSFHEVNGVAHTSRNFVAYAERRGLPMLCVRAGTRDNAMERTGSVTTLELARSVASIALEKDLSFDPLFWRHADTVEQHLREFGPHVIHMTGPSELGALAAYFAWKQRVPLAASWHTNVHEYAARRLERLGRLIPRAWGAAAGRVVERGSLDVVTRFYSLAHVLFAPNEELCGMLARATGRPCHLMRRGVDTKLFSPAHRVASERVDQFTLGYVGRLSVEKNVALLPRVQREVAAAEIKARFLVVGHGAEEQALRRELPNAEFAGVLRGEELARAFALMDVLVFPSHTDTFGNVVLEALASGVPAVVTAGGGPKFIVKNGITGLVAADDGFGAAVAGILQDATGLKQMRVAARTYALSCSWDAVFDRVYEAYEAPLSTHC